MMMILLLSPSFVVTFRTHICRWMRFCQTALSSGLGALSTITLPLFLGNLERVPDRSANKGLHPVMAGLL